MIMTMDTFIMRILYAIFIIVMVFPGSLCEECGSSVDEYYYNNSAMIPLESYCFVNECTIRIEESTVLLKVINNIGGWIIATNTTNLFTVLINDSINNCPSGTDDGTDLYQLDTELFVIRNTIYSVSIIAAIANIGMHLIFKELRTVSGILIIILCISLLINLVRGAIRTMLYYYQVNTPTEICAIAFDYLGIFCINIYQASRTAVLAHFAYTMWRTYKLLSQENERSMLYKYIIFIVGASIVSSAIVITVDSVVSRNVFDAKDGQCIYFFDTPNREGVQLSMSNVIYFVILLTWLLMHIILIIIGLVLYFLATKQCCAASTSRNLRISTILMAIVDLNTIIFIVNLVLNMSALTGNSIQVAAVGVEQVALFILFGSSNKVMCCSVGKEKSFSSSQV